MICFQNCQPKFGCLCVRSFEIVQILDIGRGTPTLMLDFMSLKTLNLLKLYLFHDFKMSFYTK